MWLTVDYIVFNTLHNPNSHIHKMNLWFSKPEIHNKQISNKKMHRKEAYRMVNSRITHLQRQLHIKQSRSVKRNSLLISSFCSKRQELNSSKLVTAVTTNAYYYSINIIRRSNYNYIRINQAPFFFIPSSVSFGARPSHTHVVEPKDLVKYISVLCHLYVSSSLVLHFISE